MNRFLIFILLLLPVAGFIAVRAVLQGGATQKTSPEVTPSNKTFQREVTDQPETSRYTKLTDRSIRWESQVEMLRSMDPAQLSDHDVDTLYSLLGYEPAEGHEKHWWVVMNEIMEQLRIHGIGVADRYSLTMLELIRNDARHYVARDYAVQHLGLWINPVGKNINAPVEENSELITESLNTFTDLITDKELAFTSIPGTTLMVFTDIKRSELDPSYTEPAITVLKPWIKGVVSGDNKVSKILRISTINAIGMLGLKDELSTIRQLVSADQTDDSIRLNCISTLGTLATSDDLEVLKSIASSNTKFRYAAQSALRKYNK